MQRDDQPTATHAPGGSPTRTFAPVSRSEFLATFTRGVDRPVPSDAAFRFGPGNVLAKRYRIVAPLGKGGMGEVYRADDLTLGQSVALKFLPEHVARNPATLDRFRKEVAAARQVAHPHVCRVFDIGEADGQVFLSMEFIPGDDLGGVLRRVGRLTGELAIDLARQVAAGLQAVHDEGLVHRDLKPANVMVDGKGRARITDFGLAATAASVAGLDAYAGTPAYQATEQLSGGTISERTDVYALGVLAYELMTGRRPFATTDRKELIRAQQADKPAPPSTFDPSIPPEVDRIVLKCLAPDPLHRPASAHEVWRALPGDAALNAALAAGVTPSAEVVADAGGEGRLTRRTALLLTAVVALCTVAVAVLHDWTLVVRRSPVAPHEELTRTAADLLARFDPPRPDTKAVTSYDREFGQTAWRVENDRGMNRLDGLASGRPVDAHFWYRVSDHTMVPQTRFRQMMIVTPSDPPFGTPGSALVRLDLTGRLMSLHRVSAVGRSPPPPAPPDWAGLFAAAGLDPAAFPPAEPEREWAIPHDRRYAWAGAYPERPDIPLRVEAATDRGQVVGFVLVAPWTRPDAVAPDEPYWSTGWAVLLFRFVFPLAMLLVGGPIAVAHVRAGRADVRGAWRLGVAFALVSLGLYLTFPETDGRRTANVFDWLMLVVVMVGANTTMLMLAYLAFEPFVRRRWPWQLVGWTRTLAGRWGNPLVGREVLVGAAVGAGAAVVLPFGLAAPEMFGLAPELPAFNLASSVPHSAPHLFGFVLQAIDDGLFLTFAAFVLSRVFRTAWVWMPAVAGVMLIITSATVLHPWVYYTAALAVCGATVYLIYGRGLLAFVAAALVARWLVFLPVTYDFSAPFWPLSALGVGAVVAVTLYGLVVSVGGWRRLVREDTTG